MQVLVSKCSLRGKYLSLKLEHHKYPKKRVVFLLKWHSVPQYYFYASGLQPRNWQINKEVAHELDF